MNRKPLLSIILPTLNSARTLDQTLCAIQELQAEVIVIDGGSNDATRMIAEEARATVIASEPGRGIQLAKGAEASSGEWLLFLHSDTVLDGDALVAISAFVAKPQSCHRAGYFALAFDDASRAAKRTAAIANWRSRVFGLPYGDQGLLIQRVFYEDIGGFQPLPIMEDVNVARRIGRRRLLLLPGRATTSAERYQQTGWARRSLKNLGCLTLYFLGVPPSRIAAIYG